MVVYRKSNKSFGLAGNYEKPCLFFFFLKNDDIISSQSVKRSYTYKNVLSTITSIVAQRNGYTFPSESDGTLDSHSWFGSQTVARAGDHLLPNGPGSQHVGICKDGTTRQTETVNQVREGAASECWAETDIQKRGRMVPSSLSFLFPSEVKIPGYCRGRCCSPSFTRGFLAILDLHLLPNPGQLKPNLQVWQSASSLRSTVQGETEHLNSETLEPLLFFQNILSVFLAISSKQESWKGRD